MTETDDRFHVLKILLEEKLDRFQAMLERTREFTFTGEDLDRDADTYIGLMRIREGIVKQLKAVDGEIDGFSTWRQGLKPDLPEMEPIVALEGRIREIAGAIIDIDKENLKNRDQIVQHIQKNLKELNEGKNMSNIYNSDYGGSGGHYLDRSN